MAAEPGQRARQNLADEAVHRIRGLIVDGALKAGQKLPPEMDLAAELGISRNSLREAVRALSQQGVFSTRQGDGTYVTSLRPEVLLESVGFAIDLIDEEHLPEVLELRRLIEPAATALAAQRIDEDALAELSDLLDQFDSAQDWHEMVRLDIAFHERIMIATGNAALRSLAAGLSQQTVRARVWRGISGEGISDRARRQHREIMAALVARDAIAAHAEAYTHVAETEKWILNHLAGLDPTADGAEQPRGTKET